MNKSFEILEALNDIDEKILIEALEDKKPKHINKTWVYFFTPTIALMLMLTCVIYINKNLKSDNLQLAKNNEIQNIVKDENKDSIIFNNNNIITASDIDGKSKKEDVISKFEFLKELNIPKEYSLINQYALYEKENLNEKEYTKLWQYSIYYQIYGSNINAEPSNIEITFTKENYILGCMLPNKNNFEKSNINDNDIYLFKNDKRKCIQAFFEYEQYKFFIESSKLTENEFIELVKSIIK